MLHCVIHAQLYTISDLLAPELVLQRWLFRVNPSVSTLLLFDTLQFWASLHREFQSTTRDVGLVV